MMTSVTPANAAAMPTPPSQQKITAKPAATTAAKAGTPTASTVAAPKTATTTAAAKAAPTPANLPTIAQASAAAATLARSPTVTTSTQVSQQKPAVPIPSSPSTPTAIPTVNPTPPNPAQAAATTAKAAPTATVHAAEAPADPKAPPSTNATTARPTLNQAQTLAYNQLALALRRSTAASQPSASTIQRVLAEAAKTPDPIDPKITTPEAPTPKPPERTTNGGNGVATVHDALAFLATQDAALKATDNIVARIGQLKEASIQAGATVGELTDLNAEYLKLRGDLESISEGTFNGVSLFSTYAGEFAFSEVSGTQFSVPSDDGSTAVQISQPNYYGTGFTLVGGYRNTPNLQSLQVVSTRAILEALALTREQNALETARLKAVQSVNGVAANAPITNEATTTTALANAKSAMIANPDAALMIQANTTAAAVLQLTRA